MEQLILILSILLTIIFVSILSPKTKKFDKVKKKAEQGDAEAQFDLGLMYLDGDGTPVDLKQAKKTIQY